jgi:uncharacterized membrane protein
MLSIVSVDRLRFLINRFRERLWVKPLVICLLSIAGAFVAKLADGTLLAEIVPAITAESIETLLSVMAASMLVIATFAVGSMVSAYGSASSAATPRSFTLVVADDVSQNALSTFIGAFIYSIVALTAMKNEYFETAGRFTLLVVTVVVFGIVILTFVRWVDRIARLGRLGMTIDQVEKATAGALKKRREAPTLDGVPAGTEEARGRPVFAATVGYLQHVDVAALQAWAEEVEGKVVVATLPGSFAGPGRALAYVSGRPEEDEKLDCGKVVESFLIGGKRRFDDDPRFGLVVLSEIAGRALSPAVNDPGTAIGILGTLVRLFVLWSEPVEVADATGPKYDRVEVPEIYVQDMFDDAFTAIARDGAGAVEVAVRLQKALQSLALIGDGAMREAAQHHGRLALARAELALDLPEDLALVREAARFAESAVASDRRPPE